MDSDILWVGYSRSQDLVLRGSVDLQIYMAGISRTFQDRALSQNLLIDRSMPYFVDVDHGGTSLNLSTHVPFQFEYRTYFVSEWKRDTSNDNIHALQSYSLDIEGCNVMVTAFKTAHDIDVTARNIRVCSRIQLPSNLTVKGARKKNVYEEGWFINQWSADLHGDVVKARVSEA